MTDTRGTFRLRDVRKKVLDEEYVSIPSVWIANDKFGHGSYLPGNLVRYNTSNSTVTNTSNQASTNDGPGGGSQTHTYWSGGGSNGSDIRKLTYSTYTYESDLPINVLTDKRNQMGTVSKETDVYYTGAAYGPAGSPLSTTQKLTFSSDSIALVPGCHYASGAQAEQASFTGGGSYGYFWSGVVNPVSSKVHKLTFSNDTMAIIPASVSPTAYRFGWNLGNTTKGYAVGGVWVSTARKLTYSDETFVAAPSANYPRGIGTGVAFTAGADTGLYTAGRNSSGPGYYSDTHLLTFSTDSWALDAAMNNTATPTNYDYGTGKGTSAMDSRLGGASSYTEDGSNRWVDNAEASNMNFYYGGGFSSGVSGPFFSQFFKITDSTDTHTQIGNSTVSPGYQGFAFRGNKSIGILAGGQSSPSPSGNWPDHSGTEKLTYSTETFTALPTSTDVRRRELGAFGPESDIIVGGGGNTPGGYSNFQKMSYSATTWSTVPSSVFSAGSNPAPSGRQCTHMGGNTTHGYVAGHTSVSPTHNSIVDKYTYATDSNTATPARCVQTRYGASASSDTALYVWALGAYPYNNSEYVPKLTYATDTVEQVPHTPAGPFPYPNHQGGSGNGHHGRIQNAGPAPVNNSYSYKWNYSTDTYTSQNPSGAQRSGMTMNAVDWRGNRTIALPPDATPTDTTIINTTPAPDVGYFTGGPHYSSTDKLNFTNDTMAAGAQMATPRYNHVCWGNGTNFLDAGGTIAHGADRDSRIEKITLSNDTVGTLPGANMPNKKRFFVGATGNDSTGYIAGGQTPSSPGTSSILKVTYASYTTDANPGCHLGASGYTSGAGGHGIGSPTAAYICAGMPSGSIGEGWHKVPYATNTATYSAVGSFNNPGAGRADDQSTGNKDKGYVTGHNPGSFSTSKTTEVVFATDTASNSTYSPNLGYALNRGATGNQTTGYFHGGLPSPAGGAGNDSYITKFVYSSDTISQLPASSKMTVPRTHCDAGSGVENSHNLSSNTALI